MFVFPISPIPFHSIFFNFSNPLNYSIPFHFLSTTFFNFPNPYTISLNLNHSYYLKISKVKSFLHHFYKPFSNNSKPFLKPFFPSHFHPNKWDGMAKMAKPNIGYIAAKLVIWLIFFYAKLFFKASWSSK